MKKVLQYTVLSVLLFFAFDASAKYVTSDQARKVATTFLRGVGCKHFDNLSDCSAELSFPYIYLFTAEGGGFVLVSADDCVFPILGYSATERFDTKEIPDHISLWFASYNEQVAYYASSAQRNIAAENHWGCLSEGVMPKAARESSVAPLLTTTWGQAPFYNIMCPADTNSASGHAVTGCTVTATAQVVKYWNFPSSGYGSHTYTHRTYGTLSADFGNTTYQWANMPDSLTSSSTQAEMEAVSTLMYHLGVGVEMGYGPRGSGAQTLGYGDFFSPSAEKALKQFFKYNSSLHSIYRFDMPADEYVGRLYAELDSARPMVYSGRDAARGGHAFVLDGYDTNGYFHVNWGWNGICNGYYAMGALNPSRGEGPRDNFAFNIYNGAIIGIEPIYDFDTTSTTVVAAAVSNPTLGTVEGAGTYHFGDTVYLLVNTVEGCRFTGWDDGDKTNPRRFVAKGGSFSFTATVEPLAGDTLGYTPSNICLEFIGGTLPVGMGGLDYAVSGVCAESSSEDSIDNYWGIRLPANALTAGHSLQKVQLYVGEVGVHTLAVYFDSANTTPVTVQDFSTTDADKEEWKTIELDSPIAMSGTHDLFITFFYSGSGSPIAISFDGGNDDGFYGEEPLRSRRQEMKNSVMVRGIFALDTNLYTLDATPNDSEMGTVTGSGVYAAGEAATLTALPNAGYIFERWSDGIEDNPRTVVVTEDIALVANFVRATGINEVLPIEVVCYPNPTTGVVRVDVPGKVRVRVYDHAGREVAACESSSTVGIDLSSLPSGIYTLQILHSKGCTVKKVVKE